MRPGVRRTVYLDQPHVEIPTNFLLLRRVRRYAPNRKAREDGADQNGDLDTRPELAIQAQSCRHPRAVTKRHNAHDALPRLLHLGLDMAHDERPDARPLDVHGLGRNARLDLRLIVVPATVRFLIRVGGDDAGAGLPRREGRVDEDKAEPVAEGLDQGPGLVGEDDAVGALAVEAEDRGEAAGFCGWCA